MLKSLTAIAVAAFAAALVTLVTAPSGKVSAGPLPQAASAPIKACTERPWPYFGCVGTTYGDRHVRLVTSDRLPD